MARQSSQSAMDAATLAPLCKLDKSDELSLQDQIRRAVVNAINTGVLPPRTKLPSSRKLADSLGVSRNTTLIAYQKLIADGHLESRQRSGVFVASAAQLAPDPDMQVIAPRRSKTAASAIRRIDPTRSRGRNFSFPPDWQSFRFPFLEGCYDRSLFPIVEWREASRLALAAQEVATWSIGSGEADDPYLIDEIRSKLLPRRGIAARPDEILITAGEQQALHLAMAVLASSDTVVGMEEPGLPEMRTLIEQRGRMRVSLPVDDDGLIVDERVAQCDVVHVSPSRQRPTAVTMSRARREALLKRAEQEDFVIIEDDFECELNYLVDPLPALRGMDRSGRVVYVASLSKVLEPGVGLGFMVAPPEFIAAARQLRTIASGRPSPNNQRAAAFFMSLGHYDAMLRRLSAVFEERLIALRDALNHYRPLSLAVAPVRGGTTLWIRADSELSTRQLLRQAQSRGVLVEPVEDYYASDAAPSNVFRLGVTSLSAKRIREGIAALSEAMLATTASDAEQGQGLQIVEADRLREQISGLTLYYRTVYGEPCTIWLNPDGTMQGRAGSAGEDVDEGRWWTEDGKWYRQWNRWAFGETLSFFVAVQDHQIFWLDADHAVRDTAVIIDTSEDGEAG
ncbi:MAG: PLP-dependent aminotransferase family protein [Pseudomonadota bacterium]|nr:PLP-dependent aminotransferase family protein [Pseudomonadota bacterium]